MRRRPDDRDDRRIREVRESWPATSSPDDASLRPVTLRRRAGVSLKPRHFDAILDTRPDIGFFEIHAENYMVDGGPLLQWLDRIREHYPLSLHGVGLSLGGSEPLDEDHLDRLALLIDRYRPDAFSEHLAWSGHGGVFLNDLLPLVYDPVALQRVCDHVDRTQSRLKTVLLLENPSTYFSLAGSTMSEGEFLSAVVMRTGCGLLLDVNNVHVSAVNNDHDATTALYQLPWRHAGQVHLAGFTASVDAAGDRVLIDSHGAAIDDAVWTLYEDLIGLAGPLPTLIERDDDIPPLPVLAAEARRADAILVGRTHDLRRTSGNLSMETVA